MHRLLLNALRLFLLCCLALHELAADCCRALYVLPARLTFHAYSSHAHRWLEVRTNMFWTLRCRDISWNICTLLSLESSFCLPAVGNCSFLFPSGSGVPIPGFLFTASWVPISGCFLFFSSTLDVTVTLILLSELLGLCSSPSRKLLRESIFCTVSSWERHQHKLNTRQVVHRTFNQAQHLVLSGVVTLPVSRLATPFHVF